MDSVLTPKVPLFRALFPVLGTTLRVVGASLFAVLAITFPFVWWLGPLSLALYFYDLWQARTWKGALWRGFVFGFAVGGAGAWWFWGTLPLDWLGLKHSDLQWYFVLASWLPVTLALSAVPALLAIAQWLLRKSPFLPITTALLFVFAEEGRMWSFALLTFGDRGLMGSHFSSASLGYVLTENHYLLQLAQGGGIYFLNFVIAFMGACLAYVVLRRKELVQVHTRELVVCGALLLGILVFPLFEHPPETPGEPLIAVLVTTDLPVGMASTSPALYMDLLRQTATSTPQADLIIFPEEFHLEGHFKTSEEKENAFTSAFKGRDVLVLESHHERSGETKGFNTSLSYDDGTGHILATYAKRFMMPGGEYMPVLMRDVFSLLPDPGITHFLGTIPEKLGPQTDLATVPFHGYTVGGLVCSDFLSPHMYRALGRDAHATILVNIANTAWFHHSHILYDKTLEISKVHAVQSRAYYLQAANGSPSYAIDPTGTLIAQTPWGMVGLLPVTIH